MDDERGSTISTPDVEREWWKEAVVYQIYPKSFNDADGDGVGDIPGIIEKVPYLDDLGVDIVWLCPVYDSPHADNGYDIRDYRAILDQMGTMDDWERLLDELHERDMRLIMDMVLNHTSDEHEWFMRSRRGEDPYDDYYFWKDGRGGDYPNNWTSIFGGPAWKYDDVREQYYLHVFDEKQPDLNWDNEDVREELYEMLEWWLEKGIDGFRLDVINLISKTEGLPDGEPNPGWTGWEHVQNGPNVHRYIREMYDEVFSKYDIMTVGEMPGCTVDEAVQYCGEDGDGIDMIVHFEHADLPYQPGGKWDLEDLDVAPHDITSVDEPDRLFNDWKLWNLRDIFTRWQIRLHEEGWNALYLGNHDHPRTVDRFGDTEHYREESAKMLATMQFTLEGTPYIYQGEEIGMTNVEWESFDELRDVEAINQTQELMDHYGLDFEDVRHVVKHRSRDNARTPMQWSDENNAGFTDGEPWIKVSGDYPEINVERDRADEDSIWHYYQDLIELRNEEEMLVYGKYHLLLEDHPEVYAYTRQYGDVEALVVLNAYGGTPRFELPHYVEYDEAELLISNYDDASEDPHAFDLRPYEARVYKLRSN